MLFEITMKQTIFLQKKGNQSFNKRFPFYLKWDFNGYVIVNVIGKNI